MSVPVNENSSTKNETDSSVSFSLFSITQLADTTIRLSSSGSSSNSSSSSSSSSNKTTTASNEKQVVKAAAAPANTTKVLPKTGATNAAPLIGGSLAVVALLMGYGVYSLVLRKKD